MKLTYAQQADLIDKVWFVCDSVRTSDQVMISENFVNRARSLIKHPELYIQTIDAVVDMAQRVHKPRYRLSTKGPVMISDGLDFDGLSIQQWERGYRKHWTKECDSLTQ